MTQALDKTGYQKEIKEIDASYHAGTLTAEYGLAALADLQARLAKQNLNGNPANPEISDMGTASRLKNNMFHALLDEISDLYKAGQIGVREAVDLVYRRTCDLPKGDQLRLSGIDRIRGLVTNGQYKIQPDSIHPDFTQYEAAQILASSSLLYFSRAPEGRTGGELEKQFPDILSLLSEAHRRGEQSADVITKAIREVMQVFLVKSHDYVAELDDAPQKKQRTPNPLRAEAELVIAVLSKSKTVQVQDAEPTREEDVQVERPEETAIGAPVLVPA